MKIKMEKERKVKVHKKEKKKENLSMKFFKK